MTEPLFPGLVPPGPPEALRASVLRNARAALLAERPDLWTRLAASRPLRLAWATAVVALLAAHALLPSGAVTAPVAGGGATDAEMWALPPAVAPAADLRRVFGLRPGAREILDEIEATGVSHRKENRV